MIKKGTLKPNQTLILTFTKPFRTSTLRPDFLDFSTPAFSTIRPSMVGSLALSLLAISFNFFPIHISSKRKEVKELFAWS
jgi:hypothetical protein